MSESWTKALFVTFTFSTETAPATPTAAAGTAHDGPLNVLVADGADGDLIAVDDGSRRRVGIIAALVAGRDKGAGLAADGGAVHGAAGADKTAAQRRRRAPPG